MPGKAPVEAVGGSRDNGPWPKDVDEIVQGETYKRRVELDDGSVQEVQVTVTEVVEIPGEAGGAGYAVTFQYDDPTTDGGAL